MDPSYSFSSNAELPAAAIQCRGCGRSLPHSSFHASAVKRGGGGRFRCKGCKKCENQRYFAARRSVHLASEIRRRERKASCDESGEHVSPALIEAVLRRWGARCFVTGEGRAVLTLIRARADRPWGCDNAVPVTRRVARRLKGLLPTSLHAEFDRRLRLASEQEQDGAAGVGGGAFAPAASGAAAARLAVPPAARGGDPASSTAAPILDE